MYTLLLDALYAAGLGELLEVVVKLLFLVVLPVGLLGFWWLEKFFRGPQWQEERQQRAEQGQQQRLARRVQLTEEEAEQQAKAKSGYRRLLLLFVLVVVALVALVLGQGD
jgi:flagellar basal body-associated protein FliL